MSVQVFYEKVHYWYCWITHEWLPVGTFRRVDNFYHIKYWGGKRKCWEAVTIMPFRHEIL